MDKHEKTAAEIAGKVVSNKQAELVEAAALIALREAEAVGYAHGFGVAHEPAKCGHARANYKDPTWGTPEYAGQEECEACAAVREAEAEALDDIAEWCVHERHGLGGVDGYDYSSGEEHGIHRVESEARKRIRALKGQTDSQKEK